jgi:hypothetical protein
MERIASRYVMRAEDYVLRSLDVIPFDRQYLVSHAQQNIQRRMNCVASVDRNVPVQYFL